MKICFIADVRSPIAQNWIRFFPARGHDVHVLATNLSDESVLPGAEVHALVSPSRPKRKLGQSGAGLSSAKFKFDPATLRGRIAFNVRNQIVRPLKCLLLTRRARTLANRINPDILHALRIPIEGELGAGLGVHPFVASIWGNDLTLYAAHSLVHRTLTYKTLTQTDGLLSDTNVDIQRARALAPIDGLPSLRIPGCGGLNRKLFFPGCADRGILQRFGIDPERPVVLNPRGFRQYVRQDTFFASIPKVLAMRPDVQFVGVDLLGWRRMEQWIERSGLASSVILTGHLAQTELAELYRGAAVMVSPTEHDGTPNSLLEAMACGCLPVCGDLPSIREWITPNTNGILVDPGDSEALARAILRGLSDNLLRESAMRYNLDIVVKNADYETSMQKAEVFYHEVIEHFRRKAPRL